MSSPQRPILDDNDRVNELFKCYGINYARNGSRGYPEEAARKTAGKNRVPCQS